MDILIVNDDGISAGGIAALVEVAKPFGNITVVAPDRSRSGMSHAVSMNKMLRLNKKVDFFEDVKRSYTCSGTPVDCVKIAIDRVFRDKKPDLVLSGINHGPNHSINTIYSGTMAAAIEGAISGIPSIAFSLCDFSDNADFSGAEKYVAQLIKQMINNLPAASPLCLNMNIPAVPGSEIKGIKFCQQAGGHWEEKFIQRSSPFGEDYYWFNGQFLSDDSDKEKDVWAINNNYVSVVPVQIDLTDRKGLDTIQSWDWKS